MNPRIATTIHFISAVPQFTVPDVVQTAEYYRDVLGFEIAGYWDGEQVHYDRSAPAVFGIVRRDTVRIHFNRADRAEGRTGRAEGAYDLYCHVAGVDDLAEELRRRGAAILEGPANRVYGQRELVVRDCNGLILAFGEATRGLAT
ncbi:MAG TPA: VOC family protein [Gemmatimonadales bacterium]|nr:VOC family protein [Gemmatimonadales bacterium]